MGRKTVALWAVFTTLVVASDAAQGAGSTLGVLSQSLCGSVGAWLIALITPIDTMQEWIRQYLGRKPAPES